MQSTLISRPGDDPHDVVVVAPDAVKVAPAEDELSSLLHQAARLRSDLQVRAVPGWRPRRYAETPSRSAATSVSFREPNCGIR